MYDTRIRLRYAAVKVAILTRARRFFPRRMPVCLACSRFALCITHSSGMIMSCCGSLSDKRQADQLCIRIFSDAACSDTITDLVDDSRPTEIRAKS